MSTVNTYEAKAVIEIKDEGGVKEFLFITPPGAMDVEAFGLIYANEDFTCEIWEGVVTSSDGTPSGDIVINTNRESTDTPMMNLFSSPVVVNYGKKIWFTRVTNERAPSGISNNYSIIPKHNTKYVWRIIKNAMGAHTNFIEIDFWWKEVQGQII